MNARFIVIILLISLYYVACAQKGPKTDPSREDIARNQQEVERAQVEVERQVKERMSVERAKQLAARHLALKQTSWGKPISVREDEQNFYVSYETPSSERRLIGTRVLKVNKLTSVVTAQKRR